MKTTVPKRFKKISSLHGNLLIWNLFKITFFLVQTQIQQTFFPPLRTFMKVIKSNFKWPSMQRLQFTTVPLNTLANQIWVTFPSFCFFKTFKCLFADSLRKWLSHFLLIQSNGEIIKIKQISIQENDNFFHIFDCTKVSRVPL